jgi:hypothetical protein
MREFGRANDRSGSLASILTCPRSRPLSTTPALPRPAETRLLVAFLRPICKQRAQLPQLLRLASLDLRCRVPKIRSGLKRRIGGVWRRLRVPKWRATADEDGHYSFAVPL